MVKFKKSHTLLFCIIIFAVTVWLEFHFPEYAFFDGGLITVILMTVFIKEDYFTYIFGAISLVFVFATYFLTHNMSTKQVMFQHLFSMLLVAGTCLVVLYVKKLYRNTDSEETQINALFHNTTEGIILANKAGEIVLMNPAAERMFKYSKDELLNKKVEEIIPQRYVHKHEKDRNQFNKYPQSRQMGSGRDLYARRKDATEFPVEISLSYYHQQTKFYVIAFIVDITVRKEAEIKLLEQKAQLQKITEDVKKLNVELENKVEERTLILKEALQELEKSQLDLSEALEKEREVSEIKSRFVSMASHEFRTPLTTVLSSASILSKYTQTDEQDKRERHINKIRESVKHLSELLEDFLSLGKLAEGKITTNITAFDVKDFLHDVVDEMKMILKQGQQITETVSEDAIFSTDKRLLKNILINLIGNAIKFSNENKPIFLTSKVTADKMEIAIRDEGMGISAEDQEHLFTSFFRGKNAETIQGTGLGLHIVSRYLTLINGDVKIESELGKGTTITVILPYIKHIQNVQHISY